MKRIIAVFFYLTTSVQAASFDRAKAATKIEKHIFSNPCLSLLDELLENSYNSILNIYRGSVESRDTENSEEYIVKRRVDQGSRIHRCPGVGWNRVACSTLQKHLFSLQFLQRCDKVFIVMRIQEFSVYA